MIMGERVVFGGLVGMMDLRWSHNNKTYLVDEQMILPPPRPHCREYNEGANFSVLIDS